MNSIDHSSSLILRILAVHGAKSRKKYAVYGQLDISFNISKVGELKLSHFFHTYGIFSHFVEMENIPIFDCLENKSRKNKI